MTQFPGPPHQDPDPSGSGSTPPPMPQYGAPQPGVPQAGGYPPAPGYGQAPGAAVPGMGTRLLARLIDGVIVGIPLGIIYSVVIAGAASQAKVDPVTGQVTSGGGALAAIFPVLGLIGALTLLYEVGLIATRGATIGKSLMKIKVVREADGQIPGWGPSAMRWLIPFAGSFVCGIGQYVVYLSPFFDKSGRQQGWHDKVAKTQVVGA
jgi:uncharacterized RDD family membrane protein YckC